MKLHYKDQQNRKVCKHGKVFTGFSFEKANKIFKRLLDFFHHLQEYSEKAFKEEWLRVDPKNLGYID